VIEPLKPIGFWSYTRSDDTRSGGRLNRLRRLLANELEGLIGGRPPVRLFQDIAGIRYGADWLKVIHKEIDEASFLLPIVTPAFLQSEMCCQEVMRFRQREQEFGRNDLIFPFHYIDVSDIKPDDVHDPALLALLNSRHRFDFTSLRHRSPGSEQVKRQVALLAEALRTALRRAVVSERSPDKPEPPAQPVPREPGLLGPAVVRTPEPGTVTRDGLGPEMVLILAGRFLMGVPEAWSKREGTDDDDARPQHQVTIARPFWIGRYPVTRGEYAAFATETGRVSDPWVTPGFSQNDRHPVVNVSFGDALADIAWLSKQTGQTYCLPSEAEWEYAARAGATTARYWGEDAGKQDEHAHFGSRGGTCPVGSFAPNAFGLHDMLGEVWEWMADTWHDNYNDAPNDGSAWTVGGAADRVVRGGSWVDDARDVRAAYRVYFAPADRDASLGFRCARLQE
jgi:formylglycine-generating enzyme required for sulfatase activity